MTVPATARRAGPFNGNGVTTSFPFTFKVFSDEDIRVVFSDADGAETNLVLDSDYSVTINADQDTTPGGSITYPLAGDPMEDGSALFVVGDVEYSQELDLPSGGAFSPRALENALDRTTFQIQQLAEELGRSLTLSVSATADTELPAPEAGKLLGWDETASAIVNRTASDIATVAAFADWRSQTFSGTGVQTVYTLAASPGNIGNLDISISGVTQVNGVDFTVSGATLTFTSAPPPGTNNIFVRYGRTLPAFTTTGSAWVSVLDFGADPTGVADCTAAFQAAVDAVGAAGGGTVYAPDGTYKITREVFITYSNIHVKGSGPGCFLDLSELIYFTRASSLDIDFNAADYRRKAAFVVRGSLVKEAYIDTAQMPIEINQAIIPLQAGAVTDLQIGDSVYLRSKQHWYGVGERFAISKIIDISGDTVTLMEGVPMQFDATGVVRTWNVDFDPPYTQWGGYYTWPVTNTNARLVVWRPVKNISFSGFNAAAGGMEFTAPGWGDGLDGVTPQVITSSSVLPNGCGQVFLHTQYAENVKVFDNKFKDFRGVVVIAMYTNLVDISDNEFYGLADDSFEITEGVNSCWYAMFISQCRDMIASKNKFYRMRHCCDGAEVFNYTQVNNTAYRSFRAAFGSHQEVYQLVISDNVVYACYSFAVLRCKDAVVTGNSAFQVLSEAQPTWGASILSTLVMTNNTDAGGVFVISGNSFVSNAQLGSAAIYLDCALDQCTIADNVVSVMSGGGIKLQGARMKNLSITGNSVKFTATGLAEYPGGTPDNGPSSGIQIMPRTDLSYYAAYFNPDPLIPVIDGIVISNNIIDGYGGGVATSGSGHGIVIQGTSLSAYPIVNVLIEANLGRAKTEEASYFVRFWPYGYFGKNIVVRNNSSYGDATTVVGLGNTDEHLFYETPVIEGNVGQSDADKSHRVVGKYEDTVDCRTLIKGNILNRTQAGPGIGAQYMVTTSGTQGTLDAGITATTTSGSPTVTLVGNDLGDSYITPGQFISIAGANTGARVIAVSEDYATVTLDANASASVGPGAAVTRYAPSIRPLTTVGGGLPYLRTASTALDAEAGVSYFLTGGSTVTVTLPAAPSDGDIIEVTVTNGRDDTIIARNGKLIMGLSEDMVLDSEFASVRLRYSSSSHGWRLT